MAKTSFRQKIFLVFFSFFLTFVFLEAGLRIGGAVFLSLQESLNKASIKNNGEYKILCLGESTTALGGKKSYPRQLENILNSRQDKIKYTVINKGIPAITSKYIIINLEGYLRKYNPDMVVTMMGINDPAINFTTNDEGDRKSFASLKNFRTFKLFRLLISHISQKKEDIDNSRVGAKLAEIEEQILKNPSSKAYVKIAGLYRAAYYPEKELENINNAIKLDPESYEAYGYLGLHHKRKGEYKKAIDAFWKMLSFAPVKSSVVIEAYANLAECFKLMQEYEKSEETYIKAITQFSDAAGLYGSLGDLYLEMEKYDKARTMLEKAVIIDPNAVWLYGKLAHCYRRKGQHDQANALLSRAIVVNPGKVELYGELGSSLIESKKYEEAENVLKTVINMNGNKEKSFNIEIYRLLLRSYEGRGKNKEAADIISVLQKHADNVNAMTKENYDAIGNILSDRKIKLVVVQYPMLPLDKLKNMFDSGTEKIFIGNKEKFEQGVADEGFDAYFSDRFAGDFGHCTPKGNKLLAENVADSILEIFD